METNKSAAFALVKGCLEGSLHISDFDAKSITKETIENPYSKCSGDEKWCIGGLVKRSARFGSLWWNSDKTQRPPFEMPDAISEWSYRPLWYYAILGGHLNIVKKLSDNDEFLKVSDHEWLPFTLACALGFRKIAEFLLKEIGKKCDVATECSGHTALFYACHWPMLSVVKALIKQDANYNKSELLHAACQGNQLEILRWLVEEQKDFADESGNRRSLDTALAIAVEGKHQDLVAYLLRKGADPLRADTKDTWAILVRLGRLNDKGYETALRAWLTLCEWEAEQKTPYRPILSRLLDDLHDCRDDGLSLIRRRKTVIDTLACQTNPLLSPEKRSALLRVMTSLGQLLLSCRESGETMEIKENVAIIKSENKLCRGSEKLRKRCDIPRPRNMPKVPNDKGANFIAVTISLVVTDRIHIKGGEHCRCVISLPLHIDTYGITRYGNDNVEYLNTFLDKPQQHVHAE